MEWSLAGVRTRLPCSDADKRTKRSTSRNGTTCMLHAETARTYIRNKNLQPTMLKEGLSCV